MKDRIKEIRKRFKLTQSELGKALGVSLTAISGWENGYNGVPESIKILICLKFHVRREWLESGDGEMFEPEKAEDEIPKDRAGRREYLRRFVETLDDEKKELAYNVLEAVRKYREAIARDSHEGEIKDVNINFNSGDVHGDVVQKIEKK